ncbi:MAG: hypothetical protein JRF43_07795 [Deltaproteobacteria bacterium]|nr:hypothetical protein [Deltaproteobacteria bacterium]
MTEYLPDEYDKVAKIFRRKGAYTRYKDLLDQKGLLEQWHKFEDSKQTKAFRKWCSENHIDFIG